MFLHLLIAFLLGIANPSYGNNSPVASSQSIPGDPGDGEGGGEGNGLETGGENTQLPPPKPE